MKIVHVVNSLGAGGAENLVIDLAKAMQDQGHQVLIISLTNRIDYIEKVQRYLLDVKYCGFEGTIFSLASLLKTFRKFKQLLKAFNPDVGHSHIFLSDIFLRLGSPKSFHRITTFHTNEPWWSQSNVKAKTKTAIEGWTARHYGDAFIGVSEKARRQAIAALKIKADSIGVVLNGVDTQRFHPREKKKQSPPVVIQVARFYPEKRHRDSIDAFASILRQIPDSQFWLVGDGPLRAELERQVKQLKLESSVKFLGLRQDIPQLLGNATVFVLSSAIEGLPISMLEAMATGVPVVVTAVGEIPLVITDGKQGYLVDSGRPVQLAERILAILSDQKHANQMGKAARILTEQKFSITMTANAYLDCYKWAFEK